MWHTNARDNSKSVKFWTSFNHLKNILSFVRHTDTWKTTSFRHCSVNTWKYALRWMPPVGKASSVFFYSCTRIATRKSIHKVYVTILGVGKHKSHCYNISQLTATVTYVECEGAAAIYLAWLSAQGWTCRVYRQCMMLNEYSVWNCKENMCFSRHYLCNC